MATDALAEPVTIAPEPVPPDRRLTPRQWLRVNLFSTPFNTLLTVVFSVITGWIVYQLARWVLVSADWQIVRVNLRLFMVGRFPKDQLWRLWTSLYILALAIGFAVGTMTSAAQQRQAANGTDEDEVSGRSPLNVTLELLHRFWPLLLALTVVLGFTRTVLPALLTAGLVALCSAGYLAGNRASIGVRWLWPVVIAGLVLALQVITFGPDGVGWDSWGGLYLTLFATIAGIALAFPLGLLLALGRYATPLGLRRTTIGLALAAALSLVTGLAHVLGLIEVGTLIAGVTVMIPAGMILASGRTQALPGIRLLSVAYIELFRAVPLVTLLFMGQFMVGFFFPTWYEPPSFLARAIIAITLFEAAYIAEIVRGGLQSVPRGQVEAAQAVGLPPRKVMRLVVLPQALQAVIPAMVGQFISLFKDTSLLTIIGFQELLWAAETTPAQEEFRAQGLKSVTLAFAGLMYWATCSTMAKESRRLEQRLGVGQR